MSTSLTSSLLDGFWCVGIPPFVPILGEKGTEISGTKKDGDKRILRFLLVLVVSHSSMIHGP